MDNGFLYLKNRNGMVVTLSNYGARIVGIVVPDRTGRSVDVVLGFGSLEEYIKSPDPYYGATIGRFANRIAKGYFLLDSVSYSLPVNNGVNHLHGGPNGFHTKFWKVSHTSALSVTFSLESTEGDEGYPGKLQISVRYSLTETNELNIDFSAVTDAATHVNFTNHAFFNLNGEGAGSIDEHLVFINADTFTPVDETLIPTGEIRSVANSPFDFRTPNKIRSRINLDESQLVIGNGYDHNFVLKPSINNKPVLAANAIGDKTGIKIEVFTTEPGMQFYTGNFMLGHNKLKNGSMDGFRTAFCFETQHYPDSPNHKTFPSTLLRVGDEFQSTTIFKFSIQ